MLLLLSVLTSCLSLSSSPTQSSASSFPPVEGGCCDQLCLKTALISEAEGAPDAASNGASKCCATCSSSVVQMPGRCLEVFGGLKDDHRVVDLWGCDDSFAWQTWLWNGNDPSSFRLLKNAWSGSCLEVSSYEPPRVEQNSRCVSRWKLDNQQLVDERSGLCLFVDNAVTGRDADVNFTVPGWGNGDFREHIYTTYAGSANGAHLSLAVCKDLSGNRSLWVDINNGDSQFWLRSALGGSDVLFGGVPSTCSANRSQQTCDDPGNLAITWPSWILANRLAGVAEQAVSRGRDGNPIPDQTADPYTHLPWHRTAFVETQMMVHDRYFYDVDKGEYTVDRFLDDLESRYGGIDEVLMWYPYPNLGVDGRNQLEALASMPGGLEGVRKAVDAFHARGVAVLLPFNPWDTATVETGPQELAQAMAAVDADGFNGDTMTGIPYEFFEAATRALGRPPLLQPEIGLPGNAGLPWTASAWQYGLQGKIAADFMRYMEPRWIGMTCNRWATNHELDIGAAFFNGIGFNAWEGLWGMWNELRLRDAELLRRAATILRHFGNASDTILRTPLFEPWYTQFTYAGKSLPSSLAVSKFSNATSQRSLFLIFNQDNGTQSTVFDLELPFLAGGKGYQFYDVYHGRAVSPSSTTANCSVHAQQSVTCAYVRLTIEPRGIGAVLAMRPGELAEEDQLLLRTMAALTAVPLANFSSVWRGPLSQTMVQNTQPRPSSSKVGAPKAGMLRVALSPGQSFTFSVTGAEIEDGCCAAPVNPITGFYDFMGVDVQYPWESGPSRGHRKTFTADILPSFYIDATPVTNQAFADFLAATKYNPNDPGNFLKHFHERVPYVGTERQPVRWVSLEDARAYCAWTGGRLPSEVEWALAAQGPDILAGMPGRLYPWGNAHPNSSYVPDVQVGPKAYTPSDVATRPKGASAYGLLDMAGLVWQFTSEFVDERTRAVVLRGGSSYQLKSRDQFGNNWYFPGGAPYTDSVPAQYLPFGGDPTVGRSWGANKQWYELNSHGKFLLMAPSMDRAGTIGFRCATDSADVM